MVFLGCLVGWSVVVAAPALVVVVVVGGDVGVGVVVGGDVGVGVVVGGGGGGGGGVAAVVVDVLLDTLEHIFFRLMQTLHRWAFPRGQQQRQRDPEVRSGFHFNNNVSLFVCW